MRKSSSNNVLPPVPEATFVPVTRCPWPSGTGWGTPPTRTSRSTQPWSGWWWQRGLMVQDQQGGLLCKYENDLRDTLVFHSKLANKIVGSQAWRPCRWSWQAPAHQACGLNTVVDFFPIRDSRWCRFTAWRGDLSGPCHGEFRRGICNLAMRDLPEVLARSESHLFVNKFDTALDPLAVQCWGEIIERGGWNTWCWQHEGN